MGARDVTAQTLRWLFADQLGPHFLNDHDGPVLLVESRGVLARTTYHRQKAHLVLSALRHRAAELGDRVELVSAHTYAEAVANRVTEVVEPTSYGARRLVRRLGATVLPSRGFVLPEADFAAWAQARGSKRLLQEDLYRHLRRTTGVLMEGAEPTGGRWNLDADNREPPPRGAITLGVPEPWWPTEDAIDESVRRDLDEWEAAGLITMVGADAPRAFAVTRDEALAALAHFVATRLETYGPFQDASLSGDWAMSHSLLSVPLNLGLLHPLEVVEAAENAYRAGRAPLSSVEGFIRQVMGWREYVWHLHWHFGESYVAESNVLGAHTPLPAWWRDLDHDALEARCLSTALREVHEHGWNHHILRLMVLGNWALQRGYDPAELTEWFRTRYVDGFEWVMSANVIGMATYADGGRMASKPYAAGGAYVKRMSNFCGDCRYRPDRRVGTDACPFTAGYWAFFAEHREALGRNPRVAQAVRGLDRLADLPDLIAQERARGSDAP